MAKSTKSKGKNRGGAKGAGSGGRVTAKGGTGTAGKGPAKTAARGTGAAVDRPAAAAPGAATKALRKPAGAATGAAAKSPPAAATDGAGAAALSKAEVKTDVRKGPKTGSASSRPRPAPTKRTTPPASARYTPPIPKAEKVSPLWVPILMFTCLGVGMLMIILNYVNVLPGPEPSNAYLMAGLALITVGFITATRYH